ncbi:hypothetical protein YC2023_065835 [Brassica napus]
MSHINADIFQHCLLENSLRSVQVSQTNQNTETFSDTISGISATEEPHLNLINLLGDSIDPLTAPTKLAGHRRRYPDLSLSPTIPSRPTGTGEEGPGGQTETMLNPLWRRLELMMADTSSEVFLPPDHEARPLSFLATSHRPLDS